jgi:CRP/FNR family transcriptional regulator
MQEKSHLADFRAGHVFFRPGEPGQVLYLLEKGQVQTYRASGNKKLIIAELEPPAIFGEIGCVGRGVYHCFAETAETARIWTIPRAELEELLREFPSVTRRLLDLVSERFVGVLLDLEATSFKQLIPRLAELILERAVGGQVEGLTHKEIAEHLRVHRESATAALGELRKAGIVGVERKRIKILSRGRLERAARE